MVFDKDKEAILELLEGREERRIVLVGDAGVGKTWMANEIFESLRSKSSFHAYLWISLNKKYDSRCIYEDIACQLSLLSTAEDWKGYSQFEDEKGEEECLKHLKEKMKQRLEEMTSTKPEKKSILVIIDGAPDGLDEEKIVSQVKDLLHPSKRNSTRFVITKRGQENMSDSDIQNTKDIIAGKPLPIGDAPILLQRIGGAMAVSKYERMITLLQEMLGDDMSITSLPATVLVGIAKIPFRNIAEDFQHTIVKSLFEVLYKTQSTLEGDDFPTMEFTTNLILNSWWDMLPRNDVITKCCWHSREFFLKHGSVHYNELISYWIMEGYFGSINKIEKAYQHGHHILMELLDYGLLKIQVDDYVSMEALALTSSNYRCDGFGKTECLGLASMIGEGSWQALERVTPADGMIKSWGKTQTLLIDGSRLCKEVPDVFFQPLKYLQILMILNPSFNSLEFLMCSSFFKLRIFVLRGCAMLKTIDYLKELSSLTVLEISGAGSLMEIPDDVFGNMPHLQSLNLSAVQVRSLPSSLSNLRELRWLILRGCMHLEKLPSLKVLKKLEVLDLSGCLSFKTFKDKMLDSFLKLETLDLSQTQIQCSPYLRNLQALTRLSLGGCACLTRLPQLQNLPRLQILDLSGTSRLKDIHAQFLEGKKYIRILNLSKSAIDTLPSIPSNLHHLEFLDLSNSSCFDNVEEFNIQNFMSLRHLNISNTKVKYFSFVNELGSLRELLLRDCQSLKQLPTMEALTKLEILDLSGASLLTEIQEQVFESLENLRQLLLSRCVKLQKLSLLNTLTKLEVLNLSGCKTLTFIEDGSIADSTCLQLLDLSETKVESLPSLSNSCRLCRLILKNCIALKELPLSESLSELQELNLAGAKSLRGTEAIFLENMNQLQTLNLSQTQLILTPTAMSKLTNLTNLSEISLVGCAFSDKELNFEKLTRLEVLDLSYTKVLELNVSVAKSLEVAEANFAKNINQLPTLNVSQNKLMPPVMSIFTNLTNLTNLRKLSLKGCSFSNKELNMEKLTRLEILDLSYTKVSSLSSLENLLYLQQLLLRECSELEKLPHLGRLNQLRTLDLWGIRAKEFPYWISMLADLKQLYLPDLSSIQELDWSRIKRLPDEINWEECGIFRDINAVKNKPFLALSSEFLKKNSKLLKNIFKKFHISVSPSFERDMFLPRDKVIFEDIYFKSLCSLKDSSSVLEIHGFKIFPQGLNDVIMQTEYLSLIGNKSLRHLSDIAGGTAEGVTGSWQERLESLDIFSEDVKSGEEFEIASVSSHPTGASMEAMKGLWLERCDKMGNILSEDVKFGEGFEILWVSNFPKLKTVYSTNAPVQSFKNVRKLYLDCCPILQNIFSPSQLPENLEILHVKFCYILKTLFNSKNSEKCELQKLRELNLIELPELVSIGVRLPSLEKAIIRCCPKLENFEKVLIPGNISAEIKRVEESWDRTEVTEK